MRSSSTSSSDPRIALAPAPARTVRVGGAPRALLLAAAIVVAGEIAVAAALPVDQGRTNVDRLLAELDRPQPSRPVVLWADSVTAGAVAAVGAGEEIRDLSSTQAVGMAGVYFTWRRCVESAGAPRLLVVAQIPESYGNDLDQVYTPTYFESAFLRWDEILGYARETSRYAQATRMAAYRLLHPPSMLRRAAVRRALQRLRDGDALPTPHAPWRRVDGLDPEVAADLARRAELADFRMSEIATRYLELLLDDAERRGTRVVLVTPALPRSAVLGWTRTGYLAAYERVLADVAARHPNVAVDPPLQFAGFDDVDMYDVVHLKPAPAKLYGARFLARVRELETR